MILTDEEIYATWGVAKNEAYSFREFARAIESAVLEKLKAQKPMCWTNDTELSYSQFKRPDGELTSGSFWAEYHEDCDIPLYLHPLQPDDVVRDAERYRWISVTDRLPDPEISVLVAREGRRLAEKTCHTGKEWLLESNHFPVTHWMVLPMTPQTRSEWEQMHAGIKNTAIEAAMKEMK